MRIGKESKRLAIYFFFDAKGVVGRYVPYFLTELKKNVSDVLIVSNGVPKENGKKILEEYGEVFVRENIGFDVWAYKEGIEHLGWNKLDEYDEVIFLNSTIMGPVYPLKETFHKMDARDLDFWGITKYFKQDWDPSGCCSYGYIPDHIQSHFIACRKSLVKSEKFHEYWENMPMINTYWEAVGKHEMVFTKYFEDLGFKSGLSVDMDDLRIYNGYPLMMCPEKLVRERRCPIFKRRMFFHDPRDFMSQTAGEQVRLLMNFLQTETAYDTDFIWETVLCHYNQADIVKNMNLNYILPKRCSDEAEYQLAVKENKVALFLLLRHVELLQEYVKYAEYMPEETDVYILIELSADRSEYEKAFSKLSCNYLEIRAISEKEDVGAFLISAKDAIMKYDLVCFAQDMESYANSVAFGYAQRCMDSLLASRDFVKNVITTFYQNPRMGLLSPPIPNHGPFFTNLGKEWRECYQDTVNLSEQLGIMVPISPDKPPVTSLETIFWLRPQTMSLLFEKEWREADFQYEVDGEQKNLFPVIKRIYPYVVQQAGFYPATIMSEKSAEIELGNLNYYLREYNIILMENGIENYHQYMCDELRLAFETKKNLEMQLKESQETLWKMKNLPLKELLKFWYQRRRNNRRAERNMKK